jgi:hypothetical protein
MADFAAATAMLLALLSLAACSTNTVRAANRPTPTAERRSPRSHVEIMNIEQKFDKIEFRPDDGAMPSVYTRDAERQRRGVRYAHGGRAVRGYVQFLVDDFEDSDGMIQNDELEASLGLGGGVVGEPVLARAGAVAFVLPYRAGINWLGSPGGLGNESDTDVRYWEGETEVSIGVEFFGVRLALGGYGSSIYGTYDDDSASGSDGAIRAYNTGYYLEGRYKHDGFPMFIELRTSTGDVEQDFGVLIGAAF